MTATELKVNYRITPEQLTWQRHWSGYYDYAIVGNYVIYRDLETDNYKVTLDNSVCQWCVDLSGYVKEWHFPTWEDVHERTVY